jgi:hypothetical protein
VNENGERRLNPNQLRPKGLPRGFQVEPAQVVSPMPDAGRSSGSRALRLSPGFYYPPLPSSKELVCVVGSCSLNARGSPGVARVPSYSLRMSRGPAQTAVYCGIRDLSTAIVRVMARYGFISTMSQAVERKSLLPLPDPIPQVQANRRPFQCVASEDRTDERRYPTYFEKPHASAFARATNRQRH